MPITLKQFDLIEVEWLDASLQYAGEYSPEEAGGLCSMSRVGYFVSRKKDVGTGMKYIVMASEKIGTTVREPMSIPEGWVVKITPLASGKIYGRGKGKRR